MAKKALELNSLQHPLVKKLVLLRENKATRVAENLVLISGTKLIEELALEMPLEALLLPKEKEPPKNWKIKTLYWVTESIFKKITGLPHPEPIAALLPLPSQKELTHKQWIVALDGVSDPGNLGTLLRTALGLGWEGAFLLPGCSDPFNERAIRAAKGATFKLDLCEGSHESLLELAKVKKLPLWAADLHGRPLSEVKTPKGSILVLGSEAAGINKNLKSHCQMLTIPLSGRMESLNVASAGAIALYKLKSCPMTP